MKKIHKSPIRKIITFCIIASFILCMTCSSYERAGSFFAASLPISTNFSILYHNSNYNMTEIQSPPVQAFFEQGIVEILETTNVVIIQQSSQLRTIGRVNRLSSLLQVLFLLFLSYLGLCTLLLGFFKVHQEANYSLLITQYIQQLDGKK